MRTLYLILAATVILGVASTAPAPIIIIMRNGAPRLPVPMPEPRVPQPQHPGGPHK